MLIDGCPVLLAKKESSREYITFPGQDYYTFLGKEAKDGSTIEFQVEYEDTVVGTPKYVTEQIFKIHGNTTLVTHAHST